MRYHKNEISGEKQTENSDNQQFESTSTQNRKALFIEEEKSFPFLKILVSVLSLLGLALYWFQIENSQQYPPPIVTPAIEAIDHYPYPLEMFSGDRREKELERIKNANFHLLKKAEKYPTDAQAEEALMRYFYDFYPEMLEKNNAESFEAFFAQQNLTFKVGKCYKNLNSDYYRCVSCMVLLYNTKEKDWDESPEGENFTRNAYDFYQLSEGDVWFARDLSMTIPYDYEFVKKHQGNRR